jgi:hypothetical protein
MRLATRLLTVDLSNCQIGACRQPDTHRRADHGDVGQRLGARRHQALSAAAPRRLILARPSRGLRPVPRGGVSRTNTETAGAV